MPYTDTVKDIDFLLEVIVDNRLVDFCRLGDIVKAGFVITILGEEAPSDAQDVVALAYRFPLGLHPSSGCGAAFGHVFALLNANFYYKKVLYVGLWHNPVDREIEYLVKS